MKVIFGNGAYVLRPLANADYHVEIATTKKNEKRINEEIDSLKSERLDELVIQGARLNNHGSQWDRCSFEAIPKGTRRSWWR